MFTEAMGSKMIAKGRSDYGPFAAMRQMWRITAVFVAVWAALALQIELFFSGCAGIRDSILEVVNGTGFEGYFSAEDTPPPILLYANTCRDNWEGYSPDFCHLIENILSSPEFWSYLGAEVHKWYEQKGGVGEYILCPSEQDAYMCSMIPVDFQLVRCTNSAWPSESQCDYDSHSDNISTIIVESLDAAMIHYPSALQKTQTIGYLKHVRYRNFAAVNSAIGGTWGFVMELMERHKQRPEFGFPETLHDVERLLGDSFFTITSGAVDDDGKSLRDKVRFMPTPASMGYHGYQGIHDDFPFEEFRKPMRNRSIDVFFAGYMKEGDLPGDHRRKALEEVKFLKKKHQPYGMNIVMLPRKSGEEGIERPEFLKMVCDSKIVVSPWGFGEWSHKDEEAQWCQSIVVQIIHTFENL